MCLQKAKDLTTSHDAISMIKPCSHTQPYPSRCCRSCDAAVLQAALFLFRLCGCSLRPMPSPCAVTAARAQGGRDAYKGAPAGAGSGEGPGTSAAPRHRVKIFNRAAGQEVEVNVPEDRRAPVLCGRGKGGQLSRTQGTRARYALMSREGWLDSYG